MFSKRFQTFCHISILLGAGDSDTPLIDIVTQSVNEGLIKRDDERANRNVGNYDCLILTAQTIVKETLVDAEAARSDGIISTAGQVATNIMMSLLAKEFDIPAILSIVHNPGHMDPLPSVWLEYMRVSHLPLLKQIIESEPKDPVYDG